MKTSLESLVFLLFPWKFQTQKKASPIETPQNCVTPLRNCVTPLQPPGQHCIGF